MDFSTGYAFCQLCCYLHRLNPSGRNALRYAHVYCSYIQKSRRYILREFACLRPLVVPPPSEPTSSYTSLPEQSFPPRGQAPSSAASRPDSAHRHQENTRRCIETSGWPLQSQHRKYCYQKYQQIILEAFKN